MNRATSATGWVRNPIVKAAGLNPLLASSYELGYTWNPITGCHNHTPEGLCYGGLFPCYAFTLANGRLKERYLANHQWSPEVIEHNTPALLDPFYPRFWPERLQAMNKMPLHKGIFVCDMSDLFGIGVPEEWTKKVLHECWFWKDSRFYLLTKQPQNLVKWSPFPDNCWVGVSATNAKMAEEAGFWLWEVKAKVKFISFEPLLEQIPVHFADYISEEVEGIKWVIIGAQTSHTNRRSGNGFLK